MPVKERKVLSASLKFLLRNGEIALEDVVAVARKSKAGAAAVSGKKKLRVDLS
jgi:hypothetical protein